MLNVETPCVDGLTFMQKILSEPPATVGIYSSTYSPPNEGKKDVHKWELAHQDIPDNVSSVDVNTTLYQANSRHASQ